MDDHHQTKAWAVHVPRLVSMLDSRAEMLCVLLRVSITHHIFVVSCKVVKYVTLQHKW